MKSKRIVSLASVLGVLICFQLPLAEDAPLISGAASEAQQRTAKHSGTVTTLSRDATTPPKSNSISAKARPVAKDDSLVANSQAKTLRQSSTELTHAAQTNSTALPARMMFAGAATSMAHGVDNRKPVINPLAYQRLQAVLSGWELVENKPTQLRLWVADLFDDPEHDFLSSRAVLQLNGVKMSGSSTLILKGAPKATESPQLVISAKDHHHGNEEEAWVSAIFHLSMLPAAEVNTHPLEGETVYRLETTHFLNGQYTLYEVVYCEAFKFVQQEVFYAAANNKTRCPVDEQLSQVGTYSVNGDELIVSSQLSSLDAQQIWTLQKQYPSRKHSYVSNYFVSVYNGKQFESYTMQKNRSAMEERINAPTGQYLYQMPFFDYLLPLPDGEFVLGEIGNFIFDHGTQVVGPYGESIDSDLNLRTYAQSLDCADIALWYDSHVIAGQGNYQIDIISNPYPDDPRYKIDCHQYTSNLETGQQSLAFDLNYSPYDELLSGEVYSYILRPKPEYAQWVEEIKLNLIYHAPPE